MARKLLLLLVLLAAVTVGPAYREGPVLFPGDCPHPISAGQSPVLELTQLGYEIRRPRPVLTRGTVPRESMEGQSPTRLASERGLRRLAPKIMRAGDDLAGV